MVAFPRQGGPWITESEALMVAGVLGGETWDSGGVTCLMVAERPNGRIVAIPVVAQND